ncbi:MAG: hypothetical protein MJZ75_04110 [Paludibacteraceae bacterium]|nr:hypothetical protein [Paludibacteraceae bacterium]
MNKLLNYIFRFRFRLARQPLRRPVYRDFAHLHTVLVLYESDYLERNTELKQVAKQWREQGKQVTIMGWCAKKEISSPILPDSCVFGTRHINLLHAPKDTMAAELTKHPCELLIDLSDAECLPLRYAAMTAAADLKIGLHEQEGLYDMVVSVPEDAAPEDKLNQVLHYLQIIKSVE